MDTTALQVALTRFLACFLLFIYPIIDFFQLADKILFR
jgi:hypothetical protein